MDRAFVSRQSKTLELEVTRRENVSVQPGPVTSAKTEINLELQAVVALHNSFISEFNRV